MKNQAKNVQVNLVTVDGVVLDIFPAEYLTRSFARIIDFLIASIAGAMFIGLFLLLPITKSAPEWVIFVLILISQFLINFAYHIGFLIAMKGTTPGKAILGLRVISADGAPASIRQFIAREFLATIEINSSAGGIATLASIISRRGQRLGDYVGNTIVIHTRRGATSHAATAHNWKIPQALYGWARSIDTAGLSQKELSIIRSFLLRHQKLEKKARQELSQRLVSYTQQRCAFKIPAGVSNEDILATVLASSIKGRSNNY